MKRQETPDFNASVVAWARLNDYRQLALPADYQTPILTMPHMCGTPDFLHNQARTPEKTFTDEHKTPSESS